MKEESALISDTKVFGFWIYLLTDLIIFASLFATYIVLRTSTFGGPTGAELFELPAVLAETLILLLSSFTCALAMLAVHEAKKRQATFWLIFTIVLGLSFLTIEIYEFVTFIGEGATPQRSAFLSSFFTLVGTHGLHITFGIVWMIVEVFRLWMRPLSSDVLSKVFRMALFWHFLDFVWIFIFTTVYGMGVLLK
jgi:cytochrome o ubiquinol oxidase subunit 3